MLQFILGTSGTGKTSLVHNKISELLQSEGQRAMLLVPDQSTFETEKALLERLGAKRAKGVEVYGFSSLCRRVFEQTVGVPKNVIDNGMRAVIMSLALEQLTEKLSLLKTCSTKGVTDLMLRTLSECKNSRVTTDMLRAAADAVDDETLRLKLCETAQVYDTFHAVIAQSYIDPLDDLERLENILSENQELFDGYTLFVDSFSGFNASQLAVLRVLLNRCRDSFVTLTLDPQNPDEAVFATSARTYRAVKELAKRDLIDIKVPVKLSELHRFQGDDLRTVARYAYRRQKPEESYAEAPPHIRAYLATDTYNECEYVAREIKNLILKQGFLYSDIAVVCHDTEPYRGILDAVLEKYEIPYFMDSHRDIEVMPVIRFVNSVFRMVLDRFEREDVLSLLKTGLCGCSDDAVSDFESYSFIWNINNRAFLSPFTQNPRGFAEEMSEADARALSSAEHVRQAVIEPVRRFQEAIKDKTGREIAELLYRLLEEMHVPDILQRLHVSAQTPAEEELATEQTRVWALLMNALDKTVAVIGEMPMTARRFYELLSYQIGAIEFSEIPQTVDSVTVTTAQRVRVSNQRVTFLIGCTEGAFPALPHSAGLFSSYELSVLSLNDVKIGESFAEFTELENFMAYNCMTSASQRLYVSYPAVNLEGERFDASSVVTELCRVLPALTVLTADDFDEREEAMLAARPAFEQYALSLAQGKDELRGLGAFFAADAQYAPRIEAVRRSIDQFPFELKNPDSAPSLFGEDLHISASQIERFSLCPFSYFCNYGLRISERLRAEINPMEYGTLIHYILEQFFSRFSKAEYAHMGEEDVKSFVDDTVAAYLGAYFGGEDDKTKAFLFELRVLSQNAALLLCHMIEELSQSDFEVTDCELSISGDIPEYTLTLSSGSTVSIRGYVDRVDVMEKNGKKYLRIIDYKTGAKSFKLGDVLSGLNLQMLLYLYCIRSGGQKRYGDIIPAGILYMPATVKPVNAESLDAVDVKKEINSDLRMNGLILDDEQAILGMDKTDAATYIPIKTKPDARTAASRASQSEFDRIFRLLDKTVLNMGERLYGGKIEASPVKGSQDACEYCPYDGVCAYRKGAPRMTQNLKRDEFYQAVDQALEEGGESRA